MNLLLTLNANYLNPMMVLLQSVLDCHPKESITVYILHSSLTQEDFDRVDATLQNSRCRLVNLPVSADLFQDAPVGFHFSKEMYYRLFAARFLPPDVDRVLYLDPDIVILNPLDRLYQMDFGNDLLAAAASFNTGMGVMHRLRLRLPEDQVYFNSGVLLMNLKGLRQQQREQEIYDLIAQQGDTLKLPDQDILNLLYGDRTTIVSPLLYNFDARYFGLLSNLPVKYRIDTQWLERYTSVIHYCGKHKPFKEGYTGPLGEYYLDIARRLGLEPSGEENPREEEPKLEKWILKWLEEQPADHREP